MTGFVCLDKRAGVSSFHALAELRRICVAKKAGHTGTLDPMATGVLPVALDGASRFIPLLPSGEKAYTARFRLGVTTDTLDITGRVLNERPVAVGKSELLPALHKFLGRIRQLPPMYSAVSKDGQRLYKLARQGIEVEREEREVFIKTLLLTGDFGDNEYELSVECSKGTYIRSLIADIGEMLGCGAVMTALKRTASDGFLIENAFTVGEIELLAAACRENEFIIPVDKILEPYPAVFVTAAQGVRFKNGGELDIDRLRGTKGEGLYRVYSSEIGFLGVGELSSEKDTALAPRRIYID